MEDSGWKQTYELQSNFSEIVRLVITWAVADKTMLTSLIEQTLKMITLRHSTSDMKEVSKYLAFLSAPRSFNVIDYDVSKQNVSMHVPLHRFLVNLLMETPRHGMDSIKMRIENHLSLSELMEPVLQTVVAVSQVIDRIDKSQQPQHHHVCTQIVSNYIGRVES